MSDNHPVKPYFQLDKDGKNDSAIERNGDHEQLVDLDEYYHDTKQQATSKMVTGTESFFSSGKLSKEVAAMYGVKDARFFDPIPSMANNRRGCEGFFQSVVAGFNKIVETIIKYIKMVIRWISGGVKAILGLRQSERRRKEALVVFKHFQEEITEVMNKFGLPDYVPNGDKFFEFMDTTKKRAPNIVLLKKKLATDFDSLKGVIAARPAREKALNELTKICAIAIRNSHDLKTMLKKDSAAVSSKKLHPGASFDHIVAQIKKCRAELQFDTLFSSAQAFIETVYDVKVSNDDIRNNFDVFTKDMKSKLEVSSIELGSKDRNGLWREMQSAVLNVELNKENYMDALKDLNITGIETLVNLEDADYIKNISHLTEQPGLVNEYQIYCVESRDFINLASVLINECNVLNNQIVNIENGYVRTSMYYTGLLLKDLEKFKQMNAHLSPEQKLDVTDEGVYKRQIDFSVLNAQTFREKLTDNVDFIIDADLAGVKTKYNTLVKLLGIGATL